MQPIREIPQQLQCGEGPVYDPSSNALFWTDALGEKVYHWDMHQIEPAVYSDGKRFSCLCLHRDGGLIAGSSDGLYYLNKKGYRKLDFGPGNELLTDLNDLEADPSGNLWITQEKFREDEPYKTGHLIRIGTNGEVMLADQGYHLGNGMAFSPDGHYFYAADTIQRTICRYPFINGNLGPKTVWFSLPFGSGLPDGLACDSDGNVWLACFGGGTILRIRPSGKDFETFELPVSQPTSLCFAGPDLDRIFLTSAALVWESPLLPSSPNRPRGGNPYVFQTNVKGKSAFPTQIPIH